MEVSWNQERFNEALGRYLKVSSRTLQSIVNSKAFFIARKAIWFTHKADRTRVKVGLGQVVTVNRLSKSGKVIRRKSLVLRPGQSGAPLAALIIQKRAASSGERSPFYGKSRAAGLAAMSRLIRKMMGARLKSIGFIKSGWLTAVKKLAPFADRRGAPGTDDSAKQIGVAKGDAKPAGPGFKPVAEIVNLAAGRRDTGALTKYGSRGLQRAFDDEAASMNEYVERKLRPDAEDFNRAAK